MMKAQPNDLHKLFPSPLSLKRPKPFPSLIELCIFVVVVNYNLYKNPVTRSTLLLLDICDGCNNFFYQNSTFSVLKVNPQNNVCLWGEELLTCRINVYPWGAVEYMITSLENKLHEEKLTCRPMCVWDVGYITTAVNINCVRS